jgi:glycogen debranching enzyme
VAAGEARYNPMSYHNGSIWPHDNAVVGCGLGQYGFRRGVGALFDGLVDATAYMDDRRIPELFCGFRRRTGRGPTLYPAACSPQAWAAGAPFLLLNAVLGVAFDHAGGRIHLVRPALPDSLDELTVRHLTLAGAGTPSADFTLRRHGARVTLHVLRADEGVEVRLDGRVPPESPLPALAGRGSG